MIIDLNAEREKRKKSIVKPEEITKIPIVEKIYTVDGEIKFEVSGYKETPVKWLDD
ncbi:MULTISPECIES: hypothetical protein [Bacillus cereus group]|uniref:hypothetical protein n=1 Tax=Bacillus cereus group TaxID=86661 RepID=UPI000BF72A3C|nr:MULTISPECIES: hypothetical protein [Bacillus cereus group]MDR4970545.1 hypothetical protein [Bacillus toyonensis]PGA04588.1 hypothetical protein COL71_27905 [Bacillus mycoides]